MDDDQNTRIPQLQRDLELALTALRADYREAQAHAQELAKALQALIDDDEDSWYQGLKTLERWRNAQP